MKLKCTECNNIKESSEFHKWNSHKRGYRYHCKDCRKGEDSDKKRETYHANKEHYKENNRKWKESNRVEWNEYMRKYRKDNPQYMNKPLKAASRAKRRVLEFSQTPPWSDLDKIKDIYKLSETISNKFGIKFHVDHIMPVSKGGLHVWWNLRIVPHYINESKRDTIETENIIFPRVSDISFEEYLEEMKMYAELALNEA